MNKGGGEEGGGEAEGVRGETGREWRWTEIEAERRQRQGETEIEMKRDRESRGETERGRDREMEMEGETGRERQGGRETRKEGRVEKDQEGGRKGEPSSKSGVVSPCPLVPVNDELQTDENVQLASHSSRDLAGHGMSFINWNINHRTVGSGQDTMSPARSLLPALSAISAICL